MKLINKLFKFLFRKPSIKDLRIRYNKLSNEIINIENDKYNMLDTLDMQIIIAIKQTEA